MLVDDDVAVERMRIKERGRRWNQYVVLAAANRVWRETTLRRCNADDDVDLVVVVVVD